MDSQIYMLLAQAEQLKSVEYVYTAYKTLNPDKKTSGDNKSGNDIENFSQNLFVECAEKALNFNETEIANDCIQIYFSLPMIANQFLARAYLCQFELLAPRGTKKIEYLEKSIPFLFKAIDFAKQNKRYNFLVYNASVIYWKYARNFVKKNYQHYLINSLKKITDSLKEIDDNDYEWRLFLEKTLIECYLEKRETTEATRVASSLLKFIEKFLPQMFDDFFEFMIHKSLITDDEAVKISSSNWELEAIYRIEKLKFHERPAIRKPVIQPVVNPINPVIPVLNSVNGSITQLAQTINNEDFIINELNEIYAIVIPPNKFIQSENSSNQLKKSKPESSSAKKDDYLINFKRQRLLLNLAHVSLMFEEVNFCSQVVGYLKEADLVNAEEFQLELEFIECEQIVKELKYKQEKYTKNIVNLRSDIINKLYDFLRNAQRLNNPRLIQLGCITQWNLCLPLLQPGLRKQTRKALQLCAECLEGIDSMEWLLRSQIHFELAKCDEEIEQLQTAEHHFLKSLHFDDAGIYRDQLNHSVKRLRLRAELYNPPDRIEDQVAMILEQCVVGGKSNEKRIKPAIIEILNATTKGVNNSGGGEINTHSLLLRAGDLLAPNEFTQVLESEKFKSFSKMNDDKVSRLAKKAQNYENSITKCADHLNHRFIDLERKFLKENKESSPKELETFLAQDYKERLKLWLDLCRISRKQQLWDLCRVSARFCLLYDDEKYIKRFLLNKEWLATTEKEKNSTTVPQPVPQQAQQSDKPVSIMQSSSQAHYGSLFDRELMRNLAEANFILGESLVQYIRGEGIELFEKPKIPDLNEGHVIKPKKQTDEAGKQDTHRSLSTDKEWLEYNEWLNKLCHTALKHFLRGIQIGIHLNESWLVCQGSTYAWNYMHHLFDQKKYNQVTHTLNELFIALQKVGHNTEPELLVAVSIALTLGLMQNWLPHEQIKSLQIPNLADTSNQDKDAKKIKEKATEKSNAPNKLFTVSNEGNNDFKKALEVVDYAMNVTNGENLIDVVSLKDRFPLIKTWVLAKQMCLSPFRNINFSKNSAQNEKIQDKYNKCMIGIEIWNRNLKMTGQPNYEIKDVPTLKDLIGLIDWADKWPDKLVELELWSNLAILCGKYGQTDNLRYCHTKALETISYFEKKKTENKTVYVTSQLLLCEACIALGEHSAQLLNGSSQPTNSTEKKEKSSLSGKPLQRDSSEKSSSDISKDMLVALRRDALNAFADAAGYAARAENYDYVIHSARNYWNLCMSYLKSNFERATLFENLREILISLQVAFKFKPVDPIESVNEAHDVNDTKTEEKKDGDKKQTALKKTDNKSVKPASAKQRRDSEVLNTVVGGATTEFTDSPRSTVGANSNQTNEDAFDDLTLRCVLYACMFQILIDKKDYEEALEQMEIALGDLPRTKHRLLIYRLKVITKSKLGLDVQMDLQKFREESEKNLAQMYRKVALESIKHVDTINSYQRAIEALSSDDSIWLKIEYILELSQWLYSHEYKLSDCIDLCEWAIDLLMINIKPAFVATARPVSGSTVHSVAVTKSTRRTSKVQPNATAIQFNAMLPTIHDEGSTLDHSQIFRNVDVAFKNVVPPEIEAPQKNLFDNINNKVMNWNDFQDIKQLECMIRAHVILAQLVQPSSSEYKNYLLKAYYSLNRLINQTIENALNANKDILASKTGGIQSEATDKKKDTVTKKVNSTEPKSVNTTKNKENNKQATVSLVNVTPQTIEQWSLYELSEEVATAWTQESMHKTGLNPKTIVEPSLTFYYLEILAKMLAEQGFSQLLFPIYNLQLFLINNVLKFNLETTASNQTQLVSLYAYVRFKLINLCVELNLIGSVSFHQQSLATYILENSKLKTEPIDPNILNQSAISNPLILLKLVQIDPLEVVFIREQIFNQKQRISQIEAEEEASMNAQSSFSIGSSNRNKLNNEIKSKKKNRAKSTKFTEKNDKNQELNIVQDINLPGEHKIVQNNLQEILYKDAWIRMAESLIDNGFFQTARDFLYESINASNNFEDKHTSSKVQYLLSKIALFDCNFIQARNLASSAQRIAVDETHWFNSIMVLVDAYYLDREDKESNEKSIQILNKAINLVKVEKNRRQNSKIKFEYFGAMFNYKLAQIISDGVLNGKLKDDADLSARQSKTGRRSLKRNTMHPALFKKLSEVCDMYQSSINILLNNGYRRETLQIFKSHAKLLQKFALDCHNQETKYDYTLQVYTVLSEACEIANEIWIEVESLQQITDIQNISFPIQRELIDLKLEMSQLLTDMLELNLNDVIATTEKNMGKNPIHKAVENFITTNENLTKTEKEWQSLSTQLPDLIFANLISCHSLSFKIKQFRAQTLHLIGRTFRLIAELKFQLKKIDLNDNQTKTTNYLTITSALSKWSPIIMEIVKEKFQHLMDQQMEASKSKTKTTKSNANITSAQTEASELTENDAILDHLAPVFENSNLTNLIEIESLKNLLINVNQTEAQGMECLLQALNLSFMIEDKLLTRNISYELIELLGRFDMSMCSQLISLYQSCSNAIEIEQIVEKSSIDPKNSLLVSYLHQVKFFQKMNVTYNIMNSPVVKQLLDGTKNKFNALKYLNINVNHFTLVKELPANCFVVVLQHNHLKTELYATVLNTTKDAPPIQSLKTPQQQNLAYLTASIKSSSIKIKTSPFELHHLQQQWKEWKSSLQAFNLKIEFQLNNNLVTKKTNSENLTARDQLSELMQIYLNSNNPKFEEMFRNMRDLDNKFDFLINKTEAYLQQITEFLQSVLSTNENQSQKPNTKLIILGDLDLFEFPLESLKVFHNNISICAISRDFSLQFFANRVITNKEIENIFANEKANGPKQGAKSDKKQTQAVALDPLPDGATIIEPGKFKYLIDVFQESTPQLPQDYSPLNAFKKLVHQYHPIASKWTGITGSEHIAGLGECERILFESHAFLFHGTERLLSYFNSAKISSFNLDCRLVISNDLAQTSKSYSRLGKLDVQRNPEEIDCENTLEACILLSLAGVKSIISNQWTSTLAENTDKLQSIFKDFIDSRYSCGEVIRYRIAPHLKMITIDNAKKDEETTTVTGGKESKKDKKTSALRAETTTTKKSQMQTIQSATVANHNNEELAKKNEEEEKRKREEDEKRQEAIKKAQILNKTKCNMILYGLPDIYLTS